jgi:DNA-binding LacI/PurR family transcriptional regulator
MGYLNAMREHSLSPDDTLIRYGNYTMDGGYSAVKALITMPNRPTALFVTNFEMTLGSMLALNERAFAYPRICR